MPIRYLEHLTHIPCRIKVLWGVNPRFHGLYPGIGQVAYALLTRAPVAIKVLLPHDAPRLACVRPVASVHPEPGSNSSLYLFFFFIIPSKRYLTELTSFSLLFLYYTCFFNSFNELGKKFPGACPVSSFAVAKLIHFPTPFQIFLPLFYAV